MIYSKATVIRAIVFVTAGSDLNLVGRSGCLEACLRKEIGIEEGGVLAYLSDGRRLRTDVSILAEVHDHDQVAWSPLLIACFSVARRTSHHPID